MRTLLTLALLLAAVAPSPAPTAAAAPAAVEVTAGELFFEPKALTAPAGEVVFRVRNQGAIEHNFVVEDAQRRVLAQIPVIAPGATEEVRATLQPGEYRIVCSYPGHAEAGMTGTLTVK